MRINIFKVISAFVAVTTILMAISSCGPSYHRSVILDGKMLNQGETGLVVGTIRRQSADITGQASEDDATQKQIKLC